MESPKTLQQAIVYFSDPTRAFQYALNLRWPNGIVTCPRCGGEKHSFVKTRKIWYCNPCKKQFTLKVGTIFEDSPIGLDKWMVAFWMMSNCKNGVSSYEMARTIGITQKSAWFMLHRIREVMQPRKGKLSGYRKDPVEIDETYIGGKARNMHTKRRIAYQNGEKKAVVMGMRTRNSREVRAMVIPNAKRETLQNKILENVGFGSKIYTDQHVGYDGLDATRLFVHETVNHMQEYVNGQVHTSGIENFWSEKRGGPSPDVQRAYRHWQCYLTLRYGRDVVREDTSPSMPLELLLCVSPNSRTFLSLGRSFADCLFRSRLRH
jgi:transposase-like protein